MLYEKPSNMWRKLSKVILAFMLMYYSLVV